MMEEAPASPKSAAIYYWGGAWGEENAHDDGGGDIKGADESHHWDAKDDAEYDDLYDSTFQRRASIHRRRPTAVKFHLTLQDDGDADHWMFAPPPLPVPDLSTQPPEEEKEDPAPILEPTVVGGGDFSDPSNGEDGDFDAIPVVDLSQEEHVYAKQIGDACRDVGFFYIINHGVNSDVMEGVIDKSKKFFELDLESKLKASKGSGTGKGYRGYFEIGGEDLDNKDGTRDLVAEEGPGYKDATKNAHKPRGDFKEGFDCGLERKDQQVDDACLNFFGENIWPDESNNRGIVGFREALVKYQSELIGLSDKLLQALAKSINGGYDLAEDYFIQRSRSPMCTLRLLHYPPANEGIASQGCGAHTDYGLFTILQQDTIGGLQVRNRNKQWIDARPLKGSFVINVGDMLSHWTNGEYASTVHRVISPQTCGDRYSVPFFFNPDHNAVVKPLSGANDGDADAKTALDILRARYNGTFQASK